MATNVAQSPTPILQFLSNSGLMNVGGSLLTQVGGVNYPTWQDAAALTPLPNPIPLNSRGEISNSSAYPSRYISRKALSTSSPYDANGNQIWVDDNVVAQGTSATGQMTDEGPFIAGTHFDAWHHHEPDARRLLRREVQSMGSVRRGIARRGYLQPERLHADVQHPIPVGVQEVM